jgi:hypothetical protein
MKKFKSLKLMLLGVLAMGSMNAFADGELTNGTLKFTSSDNKTATITGFAKDQATKDLVIPNKIKNLADGKEYTVNAIKVDAFHANKGLIESVDIQANGVKTIPTDMFKGFSKLATIKLGSGITAIEPGAFANTKIASLDLSNTSVATINNLFDSYCAFTTGVVNYTAHEAYLKNVEALGAKAVKAGDVATKGVFTEESAAAYNNDPEKNPGAIGEGDPLPYSKAAANEYNKTVYGSGAKVAGDKMLYTASSAAEKNASLDGALPAADSDEDGLTATEARVYNDWVTALDDEQAKKAILLYNSKLPGARPFNTDLGAHQKFTTTAAAYDYNKSVFGNEPDFVLSPIYTAAEAEAWNEEHADEIADDPTLEKAFNQTKEEAYYTAEEATKFNKDNKAAIDAGEMAAVSTGDLKPGYAATLLQATQKHRALYGNGAALKDDVEVYATESGANNFNATLEGAYATNAAGIAAYKAKFGNKTKGDKLTEAEANIYNATLPDAVKEGDVVVEDGEEQLFDDASAYEYNEALATEKGLKFVKAGNKTGKTATAADAAEYNASLDGAVQAGDYNPAADILYNEATADAKNAAALGSKATTTSTVKIKAGKVDANEYATLTEVKLPKTAWTVIASAKPTTTADRVVGAFENCPNLATVDFGGNPYSNSKKPKSSDPSIEIGDYAFLGTALTAIDLSKTKVDAIPATIIIDQDLVTINESLESVSINTEITTIAASTFENCTALSAFNFPTDEAYEEAEENEVITLPLRFKVGTKAFANTALESFTLPTVTWTTGASAIAASAFSGCQSLATFTFLTDDKTPVAVVDAQAFPGCKDIDFYTTNTYVAANPTEPKNSHYVVASPDQYITPFFPYEYAQIPGKYYIKYHAIQAIRVKKEEARVYNAYLDPDPDLYTLNMCLYKASAGYYNIAPGADVLIITNKEDLEYEKGSGNGSWLKYETWTPGSSTVDNTNALKIVLNKDGVTLGDLDKQAGTSRVVYGWVNSTKAGTGWQHITTAKGGKFPAGSMYILAGEQKEKAARLNVRWLDENGNVEAETTGIESIFGAEAADSEAIFNLQGVRVNGAQKGVFIQNGNKYVK